MQYKELFQTKGIAQIFQENFANEFVTIFGTDSYNYYDKFLLFSYGSRKLASRVQENDVEFVVNSYISIHLQEWLDVVNTITANAPTLGQKTTITENVSEIGINNENNTDKVKAYNDTDLQPESETANESNTEKTSEKTQIIENVSGGVRVLDDVITYKLKNFQLIILKNIVDFITLKVY